MKHAWMHALYGEDAKAHAVSPSKRSQNSTVTAKSARASHDLAVQFLLGELR